MLNRLSALCLVVAAVAGYALAGTPATAQQEAARRLPSTINRGDKVTFAFAQATMGSGGYSMQCVIADISEGWVRCGASDEFDQNRDQRWYDLNRVVSITKAEK